MSNIMGGKKVLPLVFIVLISLSMVSTAAAESNWDITVLDEPYTYENISNSSQTVQVVNLTTEGTPITPHLLNGTVNWTYNSGDEQIFANVPMNHLYNGLYYVQMAPEPEGGEFLFEAEGETVNDGGFLPDSNGVANTTQKFEYTNLSVSIERGLFEEYNAGEKTEFRVNVTDGVEGPAVKDADVFISFYNGTSMTDPQKIGNYNSDGLYYYNSQIEIPAQYNTSFVAHVNASSGTEKGVTSFTFETPPQMDGDIRNVTETTSVKKCKELDGIMTCEAGAELRTEYEITGVEPDGVNLSLLAWNGSLTTLDEVSMQKNNSIYTAEFEYPDFNRSKYDRSIFLWHEAWRGDQEIQNQYVVRKSSYIAKDRTSLNAEQGSNLTFELYFGKEVTFEPYPRNEVNNASVIIKDPSGDVFTEFRLENMTYNDGENMWTRQVRIPSNATAGGYSTAIESYNIYGVQRTTSSIINVEEVLKTFSAPDSVEFVIENTGNVTRNLTVENLIESENELMFNFTGEIANFSSAGVNSSATVTPGENNVTLEFEIEELGEYNGTLEIYDNDTDYNETVQVNLTTPECDFRNETICVETDEELNFTTGLRGDHQKSLTLRYLGEGEANASIEIQDLSDHVEINPAEARLDPETELEMNYSARSPVNDTGTIYINSTSDLRIPFSFVADVEELEAGMDVTPAEIDYGTLPEGEDYESEITVENTGNLELTNFSTTSTIDAELESENLPEGETKNFTLTLNEISSEETEVTVSAVSDRENIEETIEVTGSVIPTYSEVSGELDPRITNLDRRTDDQQLNEQIDQADRSLTQLETTYQEGDYETAKSEIDQIRNNLDNIEIEVEQNEESSGENGGETGGENQDSGGGLLPLIGIVFLLLLLGFIVYTSFIPEEGDPLYNVLGK